MAWIASGVQPEIRAQLFDASGAKIGGEFVVGADHGGAANAVVAQLAGGGFVVAWEDVPVGPGGEPGPVRFQSFDANAFGNVAGELRAYQSGGSWFVEGDTNGDGAADLVIQVTLPDGTPMVAGDFIF